MTEMGTRRAIAPGLYETWDGLKRWFAHERPGADVVPEDAEPWPGESIPSWDAVDEAGWESFPASDPPSFTRGHIG